jgi:hypothetical protein
MKQLESTKRKISNSKLGSRYISKKEKCSFCSNLYGTRQLSVHARSCIHNPNKVGGYASGKKIEGTIGCCCYCNTKMKTTVLHKHEKTCNLNLNKIKIVYKNYTQQLSTCEHCGKSGGIGPMKRYHHNNCKLVDLISL